MFSYADERLIGFPAHARTTTRAGLWPEDEGSDAIRRLLLQCWHGVRIDIERESNGGVTEAFADDLRVNAGGKGKGCVRVAEIVEADPSQTGGLDILVEELGEAIWVDELPIFTGETSPEFS
jgi:hypothetical protein